MLQEVHLYVVWSFTGNIDFSTTGFDSFGFVDSVLSFDSRSIPTIDDNLMEGTEQFVLRLAVLGSGQSSGNFVVTRDVTTIIILDNDQGTGNNT